MKKTPILFNEGSIINGKQLTNKYGINIFKKILFERVILNRNYILY